LAAPLDKAGGETSAKLPYGWLEGFAGQPPKPLNRPTKKIMIFNALRVYKVRICNIYIRA
jgi:hypothetical protein